MMAPGDPPTILRARWVVPVASPPIRDGHVAIASGKILSLGPPEAFRETAPESLIDLGEGILLPGLLNAHCHLDYTMLRGTIAPPRSFAAWIARLNALKRSFADADYLAAIAAGFGELVRTGTTAVANIGAFPHLLPRISPPPIRAFWFHEVLDIRGPAPALEALPLDIPWAEAVGISPHAPYTTSAGLYRSAAATGLPLTTHLAESAEETAMFRDASGPLHDFLAGLGRPMGDCGGTTPARLLLGGGLLPRKAIIAHANELEEEDFPLLEGRPVVHCPRSHRYFGHRPFPWKRVARAGATLCLGTDSLASNSSLDMFAELRAARAAHPDIPREEILAAATMGPARALGGEGLLGAIRPGAWADLVLLPDPGPDSFPIEAIFEHRGPVAAMLVGGEPVPIPA